MSYPSLLSNRWIYQTILALVKEFDITLKPRDGISRPVLLERERLDSVIT